MVCAKCEALERSKKTTALAVTDVWKPSGKGSDERNERAMGSNKLLEAKRRYGGATPTAGAALKGKGNLTATDVGSGKRGAGSSSSLAGLKASAASKDPLFGKCKVCKVVVAKEGAKYCQSTSYFALR